MDVKHKVGLAVLGLVGAIALAAPHATKTPSIQQRDAAIQAQTRAKLVELAPAHRRDIDYAALDARFRRLVYKPSMVGLSVGIVEGGRITFLHGYGETLAGSGDPVTPDTGDAQSPHAAEPGPGASPRKTPVSCSKVAVSPGLVRRR